MEALRRGSALLASGYGVLACAPPAMSGAATDDRATLPPTVTVEGRILQLKGVGLRTLTLHHIHACVAALYREHTSHDAGAIEVSPDTKMLILKYLRAASKGGGQDVFRQRAARICGAGGCPASDAQHFERLVEDEQFLRESKSQAAFGGDWKQAPRSPTPGSHRDQRESGWRSSTIITRRGSPPSGHSRR